MLKTFIASIRSDKAVKELDKIGIKVKEVGEDGVERFRDVQQVILDIAIKTKYAEQDIQKTLLAISGGKFQWAKVAAMLSDYKEIIKNWDSAITSQGFTDKQVEAQLDTVARKFQVLKDQITNIMVGGNNDHISNLLKGWLDCINGILKTINSIPPSMQGITIILSEIVLAHIAIKRLGNPFTLISKGYKSIKTEAIATSASIRALGGSFIGMRIMAITSINTIKAAMSRFLPTLILVGIGEAIGWVAEKLHIFGDAMEDIETKQMQEYDKQTRLISIYEQRKGLVSALTSSYALLLQQQKDTTLSAEKKAQVDQDVAETEKRLTKYILDDGVSRIKNSEDVAMAAEQERVAYAEKTDKSITACEQEREVILKYAQDKIDSATDLIDSYNKDKEAYIQGVSDKLHACGILARAEIAYFELRERLSNWRMSGMREEIQELKERRKEIEDQFKHDQTISTDKIIMDRYERFGAEIANIEKELAETEEAAKYYRLQKLEISWEDTIQKANADLQEGLNIRGHANQNPPSGGTETDSVAEKGDKGKEGRGSRRDTTKYHDPVFDHIAALLKSIDETTQRQEKIFDRQVNREGYSKDTLEKQWKVYSETLSQLRKLKEDNAKHGRKVLSDVYKDGVMVDTIDDDVNSSIAEWAKKEGDKWQGKFTDDLEKQCDSFVAAFYEELGLTKANGQKFGDDIARGGDFGGAYHSIGDGYKPQPGDFIDWGHHVGIYVGGGKYLARNSKGGIHIGSMEGMESEFGKLEGYGAIRELPNRYALPVDIKELLDKRNGNGVTLKDMPAEELIKALEDIRDNTFEVDSETGVMTSKPRTEGDTDLSKEQKLAITQLISILKTEVTQNNSIDDNYAKTKDNQRSKYLAGIKDIMNEDKESIARYYEDLDEMSRGGRSSFEEAQNAFNKATLEVTLYSNTIEDLKAKGIKGKKELKEFTDGLRSANKAQREALLKMKQNYFSDFNSKAEHEYNMQDFRSKNDPFGRKKATAELDKFAQELSALYVKRMSMYNELTLEEQYKLDEEIKTMQEKLDEGLNAYHDKLMAGYNSIVQDLIFQGKNLKEVLTTLWQDLGKDSWEKLFTGKISNPSFLTQMLGYGRPDKNRAEYDKLINSNITDMLAESYNFLGKSNSNLSEKILDMKDKLGEGMSLVDSKTALQITNNNMLQANTIALQNLATTMGVSSASGTGTGLLGGLLGGVGGTAAKTAAAAGPSLGWADLVLATGGRLDGASKSKFADGGAMASGKIVGAGTGRSDSILAYLANKDKFVWLSNGEYVINEKSAKALGYDTLDSLNKYADGGALQTSVTNPTPYIPTINPQVAQKATTIHGSNKITEALLREQNKHMKEQNEMLRNMGNSSDGGGKMVVLNTQASSADVLRALQENPRALQAILGRQKSMGFR